MPLFDLSAFQLVILPLPLLSLSVLPSECETECVCLPGEVADGSMGSRKSSPVLVSSAPQSSDN